MILLPSKKSTVPWEFDQEKETMTSPSASVPDMGPDLFEADGDILLNRYLLACGGGLKFTSVFDECR